MTTNFISKDIIGTKKFLDRCALKDKGGGVRLSTDIESKSDGIALQIRGLVSRLEDIKLVNTEGSPVSSEEIKKNLTDGTLYFKEGTGKKIPLKTNEDLKCLYLLYAPKKDAGDILPSETELETTGLLHGMRQSLINFTDKSGTNLTIFEVFQGLGKEPANINISKFRTEKLEDIEDLTAFAYINRKNGLDISSLPENTRYLLKSLQLLNAKNIEFCNKEKESVSPYGVYKHFKGLKKEGTDGVFCDNKDGSYSSINRIEDLGKLAQLILTPSKEEILKKLEGKYFNDKTVSDRIADVIVKKAGNAYCEFTGDDLVDYWDRLINMYPDPIDIEYYQNGIEKVFETLCNSFAVNKKKDVECVLEEFSRVIKKGDTNLFFNNFPSFMFRDSVDELQKRIKYKMWHPIAQIATSRRYNDNRNQYNAIIDHPDANSDVREMARNQLREFQFLKVYKKDFAKEFDYDIKGDMQKIINEL